MAAKFGVFVDKNHSKLPTLYWLQNFITDPISHVALLILAHVLLQSLTSCSTAIKMFVIKYCETVLERNGKILFWSIKISGEILNKLKSKGFLASSVSTYDFSTLYTTLPHNLIKEKNTELFEQTFNREGSHYLACNEKRACSLLNNLKYLNYGHVSFVTLSIIF